MTNNDAFEPEKSFKEMVSVELRRMQNQSSTAAKDSLDRSP